MREGNILERKRKREREKDICVRILDDILMHPQAYFEMPPLLRQHIINQSKYLRLLEYTYTLRQFTSILRMH